MSLSRVFAVLVVFVAAVILFVNWPKKETQSFSEEPTYSNEVPIALEEESPAVEVVQGIEEEKPALVLSSSQESRLHPVSNDQDLPPDVDHMGRLFNPYPPLLPIVETIAFASRTPWLEGRSVYLGDYAAHYKTSKHFISRSLRGMGNYLSDTVSKGERFNVFRSDKEIEFHLVLDLSRLKMWVYYYDANENTRVLLKSYPVSAGRLDPSTPSGCLTPTGVFAIGKDVAVYKEGMMGTWQGNVIEMMTIFGSRWIPLEKEVADCTGSCKGLGLHGAPWCRHVETGEFIESRASMGNYESAGCIRLLSEDIQELFAVIISKPTYVHIVKDFQEVKLPGKEKII